MSIPNMVQMVCDVANFFSILTVGFELVAIFNLIFFFAIEITKSSYHISTYL